jgi:hypothetical protein
MNLMEKYLGRFTAERQEKPDHTDVNTERIAVRIYSEILGAFLWVVYGPEDIAALRAQGIAEAIYSGEEITKLQGVPKEAVKTIHEAKEIFPMATIEEITHEEK